MGTNPAASLGAILLAAGGSSRLGQPKQLIKIDGEPLVLRQAKVLLRLGAARVVVVTGSDEEAVKSALGDLPVHFVHNPDWQHGMGRSLACGIGAMPERARAAMVLLCDQWKVTQADLAELANAWLQDPQNAVVADYGEATGPPAILPRSMWEKLSRLKGDSGAQKVLKRWKGGVVKQDLPNAALDIDIPEDLAHIWGQSKNLQ